MRAGLLGIDGSRLAGPLSGVSRYLGELLRAWAALPHPFSRVVLYVPRGPEAGVLPPEHPFELRALPTRVDPGLWLHWTLARAAREVDLLFSPAYVAPLAYRGRFAVTIHDALPALMPAAPPSLRRRARIAAVRSSARRAALVLTPSESTKRDVERLYGVAPERVRAIPLAADPAFAEPAGAARAREVRERYGLGDAPFLLFVGKLARRRNLPALVEASRRAAERLGSRHRLVLVGARAPGGFDPAAAGTGALYLGHVPDGELRALYQEADAFVYPSSYEGFGLPVLEAMSAGTPVVTTAGSSLSEVAGDAAVLVPQPTADALADALVRLLGDPARRRELAVRGRERARLFSWRRTAEETIAALAALV